MTINGDTKLKVDNIMITRPGYGDAKDRVFNCTIRIVGEYSTTDLKLDEKHTNAIIAIVSDMIVDSARAIADGLTTEAMAIPAITHEVHPDESQ